MSLVHNFENILHFKFGEFCFIGKVIWGNTLVVVGKELATKLATLSERSCVDQSTEPFPVMESHILKRTACVIIQDLSCAVRGI